MNIQTAKTVDFYLTCSDDDLQILRYACMNLLKNGIWKHVERKTLNEEEIKRDDTIKKKAGCFLELIQNHLIELSVLNGEM